MHEGALSDRQRSLRPARKTVNTYISAFATDKNVGSRALLLYPKGADTMSNQPRARPNLRPDHNGTQRAQFESNKKKIYASQTVCGICGKPVDFGFKFPHPLSPCIDHIIPVSKGGHPSDISNLQLAHMTCNRYKSDKLVEKQAFPEEIKLISNRVLPLSVNWKDI